MDRRDFLKSAGWTAGALAAAGLAPLKAAASQKFKIGMACTLWLQADAATETYWKACQVISGLGFKITEADNTLADLDTAFGDDPAAFKKKSAAQKMKMVGLYHNVQLHEPSELPEIRKKLAHIAKFLKDIDAGYIALGWGQRQRDGRRVYFTPGSTPQRTAQDVQSAVHALNETGKMCLQDYGVRVAWHPGRNQNRDIIRQVLDGTDPRHVFFCADVGHLAGAGYEPVEAVRTYGSRIAASHWKDFDPNIPFRRADYAQLIKGDFVELGRGVVNFPALVDLFNQLNYTGAVQLELDRTLRDPVETAREMKDYVTGKLQLQI